MGAEHNFKRTKGEQCEFEKTQGRLTKGQVEFGQLVRQLSLRSTRLWFAPSNL